MHVLTSGITRYMGATDAERTPTREGPRLSVALGNTLELVLLLDGVAVRAALGGVHELVGEAFGDGLDVSEGGFTDTDGDEGVDEDLDRVGVGHEVDNLEGVLDDPDGHLLLAVVAAVHHQGADESLDDGHLSLAELLASISAGGVGEPDWVADLDVVLQGDILAIDL